MIMPIRTLWAGLCLLAVNASAIEPPAEPMSVWFVQPAQTYDESSVVGNGRLGAMDFGGVTKERIVLNESSMWSGGPYEANRFDAYKCLPEMRQKLFAGDIEGAEQILNQDFGYADDVSGWFNNNQIGCYQILGDLLIDSSVETGLTNVTNYRRDLNLMTGIATTSYTGKENKYTRELIASRPDDVIALRLKAAKPGTLSFTAALSRQQHATAKPDAKFYRLEGQLPFDKPGAGLVGGTRYLALLGAKAVGGTVTATSDGLVVNGADEVTFIVSAGTDLFDTNYATSVEKKLVAALGKSFDELRQRAVADHAHYMDRCQLTLPAGTNAALPTPERVRHDRQSPDPSLTALYFQFGRYLMVAGSRPDSPLPLNLQGIWADEYATPWCGDFHSNINIEMNYWPAEVANLSECQESLFRFLEGMARAGTNTARAYYNAPGWLAFHTQNPWYETAPSCLSACTGPTCGAWLAQHIWTHYQFTRDKAFLRKFYPILRGAAQFCLAVLVEDPQSHRLVTVPSNSPENAYAYTGKDGNKHTAAVCIGSTYDEQIIHGLFSATAEAARILGVDDDFSAKLDAARARLAPTHVNAEGRIMEWQEDFEETEIHHRHISHLWGLFPGDEINTSTPELYRGARLSLERRGDDGTGWSMAWKACLWARLHDGDHSDRLLANLISSGNPNLFDQRGLFQIDGNFGGCAAVAEMLVQSQADEIELLPALPQSWTSGHITGLRARGGFEVDIAWQNGKLTFAKIHCLADTECKVRYGQKSIKIELKPGQTKSLSGE